MHLSFLKNHEKSQNRKYTPPNYIVLKKTLLDNPMNPAPSILPKNPGFCDFQKPWFFLRFYRYLLRFFVSSGLGFDSPNDASTPTFRSRIVPKPTRISWSQFIFGNEWFLFPKLSKTRSKLGSVSFFLHFGGFGDFSNFLRSSRKMYRKWTQLKLGEKTHLQENENLRFENTVFFTNTVCDQK